MNYYQCLKFSKRYFQTDSAKCDCLKPTFIYKKEKPI